LKLIGITLQFTLNHVNIVECILKMSMDNV
jgi:hypothetical protein